MIEDSGAVCDIFHAGDTFKEVREAMLEASKDYDVIMTTGGTAISKGDVVLDVVDDIGEILFHGVAIRPGKPIGAGIVNDKMVFTFTSILNDSNIEKRFYEFLTSKGIEVKIESNGVLDVVSTKN